MKTHKPVAARPSNVVDLIGLEVRELGKAFRSERSVKSFVDVFQCAESKSEIAYVIGLIAPLIDTLARAEATDNDREAQWKDICALAWVFQGVKLQDLKSDEAATDDKERTARQQAFFEIGRELALREIKRTETLSDYGEKAGYDGAWATVLAPYHESLESNESLLGFHPGKHFDQNLEEFYHLHFAGREEVATTSETNNRRSLEPDQLVQLAELWATLCLRFARNGDSVGSQLAPSSNGDEATLSPLDAICYSLAGTLMALGDLLLPPPPREEALPARFRSVASHSAVATPALREPFCEPGNPVYPFVSAALFSLPAQLNAVASNLSDQYKPAGFTEDSKQDQLAAGFRYCLQICPWLPPDLAHEVIVRSLSLHDFHDLDREILDQIVEGLALVTKCGSTAHIAVSDTGLDADACELLEMLAAHSTSVSWEVLEKIATWLDLCEFQQPGAWSTKGWEGDPDVALREVFRYVQQRLIEHERYFGGRTPFTYDQLQLMTTVFSLPPLDEPLSASWALAQVFEIEIAGYQSFVGRGRAVERGRNYMRLIWHLRNSGLFSLAAAAHCFFVASQAIDLFRQSKMSPPNEPSRSLGSRCFVDDWRLFADNTTALLSTAFRDKTSACVHFAADALREAGLLFEAGQLSALVPTSDSATQRSAVALVASALYRPYETRLIEKLGVSQFDSLPEWVRETLKDAERFRDFALGDTQWSKTPKTAWVLDYAKTLESLLKSKVSVMWSDSQLAALTKECYERKNARPFPPRFTVGPSLRVMRHLAKGDSPPLRRQLDALAINVEVLGGPLGSGWERDVLPVRNAVAHGDEVSAQDAEKCRDWVLANIAKVVSALGLSKPPGSA